MKKLLLCIIIIIPFFNNTKAQNIPWSIRMADSQIQRSGTISTWDYPNGLFVESVLRVFNLYKENKHYDYAKSHADASINDNGIIKSKYSFSAYTLDNINPGMFLIDIYETERSQKYKTALDTLRKQINYQPRNESGGFWHKNSYPNQMWLDGLYMGTRFYLLYDLKYSQTINIDDIINQYILIHSKTYDPIEKLNYHAWSETPENSNSFWANKTEPFKGCSKEFWGRGVGWYMAALVDVLDILPSDYPERDKLIKILNEVAEGIKERQDEKTGCWYQLLRYDNTLKSGSKYNYLEASASSMFTYSFLKALRLGLISKTDYEATALKAYEGLINNFISESNGLISLNNICKSAGLGPASDTSRDGTIYYYLNGKDAGQIVSNDLKGVGPFIMASVEYEMRNIDTHINNSPVNKEITETVFYDITGRKVTHPTRGIFIKSEIYNDGTNKTQKIFF